MTDQVRRLISETLQRLEDEHNQRWKQLEERQEDLESRIATALGLVSNEVEELREDCAKLAELCAKLESALQEFSRLHSK